MEKLIVAFLASPPGAAVAAVAVLAAAGIVLNRWGRAHRPPTYRVPFEPFQEPPHA